MNATARSYFDWNADATLEQPLELQVVPGSVRAGEPFELRACVRDGEWLRLFDARLRVVVPPGIDVLAEPAGLSDDGVPIVDLVDGELRARCVVSSDSSTIEPNEIRATLSRPNGSLIASATACVSVICRPCLENDGTRASFHPVAGQPGDYEAVVAVHNSGPSVATGVAICIVPSDEMSAREPAGGARGFIDRIAGGATAEVRIPIRLAEEIAPERAILGSIRVACPGQPQFLVPAGALATSECESEEPLCSLSVDGPSELSAGDPLRIRLRLENAGRSALRDGTVRFQLPGSLCYAPGSARLNGIALSRRLPAGRRVQRAAGGKRRIETRLPDVSIHYLEPAAAAEIEILAYAIPGGDPEEIALSAEVGWAGGSRRIELPLTVRSSAAFPPDRNRIELVGARDCRAGDLVSLVVHLQNAGASFAPSVRVAFRGDEFAEVISGGAELGTMDAGEVRAVDVRARVPDEIEDGTRLTFGAAVAFGEGNVVALDPVEVVVRSSPRFECDRCSLECVDGPQLRPGRKATLKLLATNSGSSTARQVRATFALPAGIERADGTDGLDLGDVHPRGSACGTICVVLTEPLNGPVPIRASLHANGMLETQLDPLWLQATAVPEFAAACSLEPSPDAALGDSVTYQLDAENVGDGVAKRLTVYPQPLSQARYIRGSTFVNGMALVDRTADGSIYDEDGLWFEALAPGQRITVRWSLHACDVAEGLSARIRLVWDGGGALDVVAPELRVAPCSEPEGAPPLPFRVGALVRPAHRFAEAVPEKPRPSFPVLELDVDAESRRELVGFLNESSYRTLAAHVLALRVLLPNRILGADEGTEASFRELRETYRSALDRLYIKLRIPGYVISARDLESNRSRTALIAVMDGLRAECPPADACARETLRGTIAPADAEAIVTSLRSSSLGNHGAIEALALLIPCESAAPAETALALRTYRAALLNSLAHFDGAQAGDFLRALQEPGPQELELARCALIEAFTPCY